MPVFIFFIFSVQSCKIFLFDFPKQIIEDCNMKKLIINLLALSLVIPATAEQKGYDKPPVINPHEFRVLLETSNDPMFQHPVNSTAIDPKKFNGKGGYPEWKKWPIMSMSKSDILKLVPKQVGLLHLGCPECNAGPKYSKTDFNDNAQLPRQWSHWQWDYKKPEEYSCKKCGERFPENNKYPMSNVDKMHNRLGEVIERRYWLDTAKDKKGFKKRFPKYYFDSQIDYFKMKWCEGQLRNLMSAYILTGDEDFAYKAAIIVDAFCDAFPHWLYMKNYAHEYLDYKPGIRMKSTYTRTSSRRGENKFGPIELGKAYDTFFNSSGFQKYSNEIGVDLRVKYMTRIVKFMKSSLFDKGKLPDTGMDGWQQGCPGSEDIKTGKLLHDPRYMHRFADQMKRIPFIIYGSDGGYFEGSGYTCLQLNPMMRMRDMNGYSDPKSFIPPEGGKRLENWWYPTGHYEEFHRKAYNLQRELALPHGGAVVYNDSGGGFPSASYIQQTKKPRSFNVMKHGLKHVVLGDGTGEDQIQTHLLFGLDSKHGHSDSMSMQIFAKGHYIVDDITYPKHRMRAAYGGVLFHNTANIDGRSAAQGPVGDGKPEFYEPRFNGISAVRIDGENMYTGTSKVYERTLINVTIDPKRPYVVDLFRMDGGRQWRDYMLLGSYRHRAEAKVDLPVKKLPGVRPLMRPGAKWQDEGKGTVVSEDRYGLFTNVRAIPAGKDFKLTYTLKDTWREKKDKPGQPQDLYLDPEKPVVGMVNHFIGIEGATPYLATIPRRVDKVGPVVNMEQMPQLIFRDTNVQKETQFVCVHEPFKGETSIKKVSRLNSSESTLALEIEFKDGRKDIILMSTDATQLSYEENGIQTDAKLAVLSTDSSGKSNGWMLGGTYLKSEAVSLKNSHAEFKGKILKSFRKWDGDSFDGFEVEGAITDANKLVGAWVMVDNKGKQERFYDRIINNSIDEWYSKYHSRSKGTYEAAKKKDPNSHYVSSWEESQKRWEACKTSGAGWGFEIKRVIQMDNKTFIITKDDHGLKIDGKSKFTKELFFPNRQLNGADTTFWINTAVSTVPMKNMNSQTLTVKPGELKAVKKNLMPYPQDGSHLYRYIHPENQEDFETEIIIDVTDLSIEKPASTKPGLLHYVGSSNNISGYNGVAEGEMRQYIFKPKGGEQHFQGFLKIPRDGVYTIHYRAGGNGELLVGGKVVSPQNRYLGAPYPRIIHLKARAGYLPIEFWSNMIGSKYWTTSNEISWEGPGFERKFMEFSDFVYSQKDLEKIAEKVSVNKLGSDDENRYEGIKNFYLGAFSGGDGEVFLNDNLIGELKAGQLWTHSTNLQKGDVLTVKTTGSDKSKKNGVGLACLFKGKPFFSNADCSITFELNEIKTITEPLNFKGKKALNNEVYQLDSGKNPLKFFNCKPVWVKNAKTVWLKYTVK